MMKKLVKSGHCQLYIYPHIHVVYNVDIIYIYIYTYYTYHLQIVYVYIYSLQITYAIYNVYLYIFIYSLHMFLTIQYWVLVCLTRRPKPPNDW